MDSIKNMNDTKKQYQTVSPQSDEERRHLKEMAASDFSIFVPTEEKIILFWDFFSIKYLLINSSIYAVIYFALGESVLLAGSAYIILSMPIVVFLFVKINRLHSRLYELRFVLPEKNSYTSSIINIGLIGAYRELVKAIFSLVVFFAIVVISFLV